jgi:hypothetical protein
MASIINAVSGSGIASTADGSGIIKIQSNSVTTNALAWVNFNGTGTVAIRSSYNVSSITDNGTGDYTVNFATALSDANYVFAGAGQRDNAGTANNDILIGQFRSDTARTTSSCRVVSIASPSTPFDAPSVMVIFFGN